MNIQHELLREHSNAQANRIADYVGDNAKRFAELMKLVTAGDYRTAQRAAWPLSLCIERHPGHAKRYFETFIIEIERDDAHPAVRRNIVRLLQFVDVPSRYRGRIFDLCYRLFADVSQSVAVRVDAMTVAADLAKGNEDLLEELRMVAKAHPEKATPGFRARSRRVLGV